MKRGLIVFVIVAAIGAGAGAYYVRRGGPVVSVNTSPVTRGDIVDTVGSTGTLQAVTTVQVGSQVSGNIAWLGADFNSIVKKDQVIAKLDPSLFQAQVDQSKASLVKSQADLERNKVTLIDAQQKFTRARELASKSLIPQSDMDAAKIAVDSADAALKSSQATVEQAQATLNQSQVNLDHTIITAPIDGIVTQRSVDVGQTVAASLQSPTLFVLAADLTKMQVNANVDEADVGRIRPGQHVTFRVDAYPTETFEGTVAQIRLQPVVVQNVTTYGTVINVPNAVLKLKPGMTANVKIEVAKRSETLRVPNAAVRFRPAVDVFAALNQAVPPEAQFGGRGGRGRGGQRAQGAGASADTTTDSNATAAPAGAAGAAGAARGVEVREVSAQGAPAAGGDGQSQARGQRRRDQGGEGSGNGGRERAGAGDGGGRGQGGDRRTQFVERFKSMTPDEQKQFIERLKGRGQDTSAFEALLKPAPGAARGKSDTASALLQPKYGQQTAEGAQTIDALFAPIPTIESRGRVWLFVSNQLKPVNVRLGITDGTNTELMSDELQPGMEVVTGVTGVGSVRGQPGAGGGGNPLLPQRGGARGR
jgi:HlyD family secretion protein